MAYIEEDETTRVLDAYCVLCKAKRVITEREVVTMKNGRKAFKGKCGECGTGLYRIAGKKDL